MPSKVRESNVLTTKNNNFLHNPNNSNVNGDEIIVIKLSEGAEQEERTPPRRPSNK
jgi:hypothetical protein